MSLILSHSVTALSRLDTCPLQDITGKRGDETKKPGGNQYIHRHMRSQTVIWCQDQTGDPVTVTAEVLECVSFAIMAFSISALICLGLTLYCYLKESNLIDVAYSRFNTAPRYGYACTGLLLTFMASTNSKRRTGSQEFYISSCFH